MDNPENPTEPETPEPFTLPLEHDEDSEPENTISQPTPIQVKGSEEKVNMLLLLFGF